MAEENKDKKDIEDEEDTLSPEDIDSEMSKAMNDDREEEEEKASKVKGKGLEGVAEGIQGGLEDAPLDDQVKTSFLDYAMSTITARALPDVRDGLKPVTRRIIYGTRQHHVLQGGVLGEEVEVLEHQAEVEPLFSDLALLLGGGVGGVPHGLAVHLDDAGIRALQEVQAAQQRRFTGTRRADDGQRLAFFQGQRDVLQDMGLLKIFPDAGGFEQCHNIVPP